MQGKKTDWVCGIDYVLAPDDDGNIGFCIHCEKKFKNERSLRNEHKNFCKMLNGNDGMKQMNLTPFIQEKVQKKEDEKLREIAKFICETATPLNAVQNEHFRNLTKTNFSTATIRQEIIDLANELKTETKKKFIAV